MSAPQLADSSTSSEWFRTVAEPGAEKAATTAPEAVSPDVRRKRFVRLVTYTMGGLVAFTLLGIASFAWRRHSMQAALAEPVPAEPAAALAPMAEAAPVPVAEAVPAAAAAPAKPAAAPKRAVAAGKPAKKPTRSPFLSAAKPQAKTTASSARKP